MFVRNSGENYNNDDNICIIGLTEINGWTRFVVVGFSKVGEYVFVGVSGPYSECVSGSVVVGGEVRSDRGVVSISDLFQPKISCSLSFSGM